MINKKLHIEILGKKYLWYQILQVVHNALKADGLIEKQVSAIAMAQIVRKVWPCKGDSDEVILAYARQLTREGRGFVRSNASLKRATERRELKKELLKVGNTYAAINMDAHATDAVRALEAQLSKLSIAYQRELPVTVYTGKGRKAVKLYILDFYLPEYNLAIEVDGGYHNTAAQRKLDATRDKLVKEQKCPTVRLDNHIACMPGFSVLDYLPKRQRPAA